MSTRGITVVDVCRELGIEPEPELTWAVGAAVRDFFERRNGRLPRKGLRPKTNGPGSHCFAIYPRAMRRTIASFILMENINRRRQGELPL